MEEMEVKESEERKLTYKDKLRFRNSISQPMASKKLTKKILKLIKTAAESKKVFIGLKEVQKQVVRGAKGIVIFGADVTPIDVICHMPALCEEREIPYCYTPSREDLGKSAGLHRAAVMILILPTDDWSELFQEVKEEIAAIPPE